MSNSVPCVNTMLENVLNYKITSIIFTNKTFKY